MNRARLLTYGVNALETLDLSNLYAVHNGAIKLNVSERFWYGGLQFVCNMSAVGIEPEPIPIPCWKVSRFWVVLLFPDSFIRHVLALHLPTCFV